MYSFHAIVVKLLPGFIAAPAGQHTVPHAGTSGSGPSGRSMEPPTNIPTFLQIDRRHGIVPIICGFSCAGHQLKPEIQTYNSVIL